MSQMLVSLRAAAKSVRATEPSAWLAGHSAGECKLIWHSCLLFLHAQSVQLFSQHNGRSMVLNRLLLHSTMCRIAVQFVDTCMGNCSVNTTNDFVCGVATGKSPICT